MYKEQLINEYKKHKKEIQEKLKRFRNINRQKYKQELFFCLLTPQSKAEKCWQAVEKLQNCNLKENNIKNIQDCLKSRTRFYRNKARYLIEANKKIKELKQLINSNKSPREIRKLLTDSKSKYRIKGLGMKEASHFLRNIGKSKNKLAILDRHILEQLKKLKIIDKEIRLSNKNYLKIENKLKKLKSH